MNQQLRDVIFSGIVTVRDKLLQLDSPLRLESGEPSFDTPTHIKDAMIKAMHDNHTHYAPSTGIKPLKEAIYKKITEKNNINIIDDSNKIVVTNGGMHALYCTFRTILNKGDEVIIPQPNWTATAWIIELSGGILKKVKLKPELAYRWDIDELEQNISKNTKAILINSPHNPTGGVCTADDYRKILALAEKHNLYIVSDEAYEDIIYDSKHVSAAAIASEFPKAVQDKVISAFTFSKSYAMTGWRLGYIVCSSNEFADQIKKMILYTINGVSTPTQYGGIAALEGPQDDLHTMCNIYKQRRDLIFEGVNATEFLKCATPPGGAFYLYAKVTDTWEGSAWDLVNYLIDNYSLGSVPGDIFYDDEKSIRFSYACDTAMIEKAVENLKKPVSTAV
ncbi:MAG: pyridoxal phosphate-dependent aminotransferase [Calditrichaeota bacterium]|nr:MAG: pyridoxal phosphate-dependent aminotransferase [Calditrichota bacterium]